MTDIEILKSVGKSLDIIENKKAIAILELTGEFIYVTKSYLEMMGNPDIIGKRLRDSNHPGVRYVDQLRNILSNVIETGNKASYFFIYQFPSTMVKRCYINHCSLLYNPETNAKIGLLAEIEPFNCKYIGNVLNITNQLLIPSESEVSQQVPTDKVSYQLSDREQEILFLLMIGRSYKEITYIINKIYDKSISISAINSIIRVNLFNKFKTSSVSSLIQIAASNSVIQEIPASLLRFPEGFFEVDYF